METICVKRQHAREHYDARRSAPRQRVSIARLELLLAATSRTSFSGLKLPGGWIPFRRKIERQQA